MTSADRGLRWRAGVGALAHDEGASGRTTGIAGASGQGPVADHNSIAQVSGVRLSAARRAGQVSGHGKRVTCGCDGYDLKI